MIFHIKEAREHAGMSQKDLAEKIGVAPTTFHGYESGKHDPKSELLVQIARVCGVSVDFLLGLTNEISPTSAETDAGEKVTMEEVYQALINMGFVKEGEDLTDSDLAFLMGVGEIIKAWFSSRGFN